MTAWLQQHRVRLASVLLAAAAGAVLDSWQRGREFRHVLQFVAFAVVSFALSQWFLLLLLGSILALLWLWLARRADRFPDAYLVVATLNRWLGHAEALGVWIVLLVVWHIPFLAVRFALAAAVFAFGGYVVDHIGQQIHAQMKPGEDPTRVDILRARRPAIYGFTGLGIFALIATAPSQARILLPGAAALVVTCAVRLWATFAAAKRLQRIQPVVPAKVDRWAVACTLGLLFAFVVFQMSDVGGQEAADCANRSKPPSHAPDRTPSQISLFLVSDNQFHELRGKQSYVRLPMVDHVVPVAVRPLELDLLSGVTWEHFAAMYQEHRRDGMLWAHLGDYGDLGCSTELDRLDRDVGLFGTQTLAALTPGNHDSSFTGNFEWHPDWATACAPENAAEQLLDGGTPLLKAASNARLAALTKRYAASDVLVPDEQLRNPTAEASESSALPTLATLGRIGGREVLAVFLDTSDHGPLFLGIAGVQGDVSSRQLDWVEDALAKHGSDAAVVLFLHHPTAALSVPARWLLRRFVHRLGARLRGIVTAHTHLAATRASAIGGPPEIVLGSITDPPQEAAVLDLSASGDRLEDIRVRVRTVQAVVREARGEEYEWGLPRERCEEAFARLKQADACRPFTSHGKEDGFAELFDSRYPLASSRDGSNRQWERARRLYACVCRDGCAEPASDDGKLDPRFYESLYEDGDAARKDELVCLSWAASVLQGKKGPGMEFEKAMAESLDPQTVYGVFEGP